MTSKEDIGKFNPKKSRVVWTIEVLAQLEHHRNRRCLQYEPERRTSGHTSGNIWANKTKALYDKSKMKMQAACKRITLLNIRNNVVVGNAAVSEKSVFSVFISSLSFSVLSVRVSVRTEQSSKLFKK